MENNPTNSSTSPIGTEAPVAPGAASASPVTPAASAATVTASPKKPGMGKKPMMIILLLLVILVLLGIGGYFYYANMMDKPEPVTVVPTLAPVETVEPTQEAIDAITDETQLDEVVNELDNLSEEAGMLEGSTSLQSDSNF